MSAKTSMQIIVGLGNPGSQYDFTRHNFGFLALDFYAKLKNFTWKNAPKFKAQIHHDQPTSRLYVKPQTFYNESGQSLALIKQFYKLNAKDFFIICDDFNLDFGQLRFREKGSDGGNNGLKSAIAHLGSTDFPRLRLGTNDQKLRDKLGDANFVLSGFTTDERAQLPNILVEVSKFIEK